MECIGFAYNLSPGLVSEARGVPSWINSERYDIVGETPGEIRPPNEEVLRMFRALLEDRFKLKIHREQKEVSVYNLVLAKDGAKMHESAALPGKEPGLVIQPGATSARLPARNATVAQFASLLQRVIMDRPVVDKTGLSAKYDFDLEWRHAGTQLDRGLPPEKPGDDPDGKPDIFAAIQQLGLKLEPAKARVEVLVIDHVEKPDAN
jgi:uncharacterized protein (TIGR03435 family)